MVHDRRARRSVPARAHGVVAVVVAAGQGRRMGRHRGKLHLRIGGIPLLVHALRRLTALPLIGGIVVVARSGGEADIVRLCRAWRIPRVLAVVRGGSTRAASVWCGLQTVPASADVVLIHDGARPFPSSRLIADVARAARRYGAAIAAVPVTATVKEADDARAVRRTVPRERLWLAQTPQGFRTATLRRAYQRVIGRSASADAALRRLDVPDDASIVERAGGRVRLVRGETTNIKVTVPADLLMAIALCRLRIV